MEEEYQIRNSDVRRRWKEKMAKSEQFSNFKKNF